MTECLSKYTSGRSDSELLRSVQVLSILLLHARKQNYLFHKQTTFKMLFLVVNYFVVTSVTIFFRPAPLGGEFEPWVRSRYVLQLTAARDICAM